MDGLWDAGVELVHTTTVQPAMNVARSSGEWIASGTSAAAGAAQTASQWLAANATTIVITAQDTGPWVVTSSSSALNSAMDGCDENLQARCRWWMTGRPSLVKEVENHLRADGTSEFAMLVKDSGFALANIRVEVGIIPELAVEFQHERSLTPEEVAAFKIQSPRIR